MTFLALVLSLTAQLQSTPAASSPAKEEEPKTGPGAGATVEKNGQREVEALLEKLELPNGIEFHKGSLYVATPKAITRYDNIDNTLGSPGDPVRDQLPGDVPHGWKFIKIGPDGKPYVPAG